MHFVELKICEKVGNVLEECNSIYRGSMHLLYVFMDSETYERIIDGDVALYSQAKSYIARCFMKENKKRLEEEHEELVFNNEVLFWIGYLITYWCLEFGEKPRKLLQQYDIKQIVESYEVLHSLSVKTAIEKIKEDYVIG